MKKSSGVPGGIAPPAIVLILSVALMAIALRDPELIDLGPHFSAAGIGVLAAAISMFWLLIALGTRKR